MPKVKAFCSRGFFPKELPPPFQATTFGVLAERPKAFPNAFNDINIKYDTFRYSLARSGEMRRTLHVMNPIVYYNLSKLIVTKWRSITRHIARSPIGLSFLTNVEDRERALKRFRVLEQLPRERAIRFASYRYLLKSDITRFSLLSTRIAFRGPYTQSKSQNAGEMIKHFWEIN
jgi:hypothetical protein